MAAGYLPEPGLVRQGREIGPCVDECEHRDCAQTRAEAAAPCKLCGEPIGYDRGFYRDDEHGNEHRMVHAICLHGKVL